MNFVQEIKEVFDGREWCWGNCCYGKNNAGILPNRMTIISGSFNPLHNGHLNMAQWVIKDNKTKIKCINEIPVFELSIMNCDKGTLSLDEVLNRVDQFRRVQRNIIVTRCPNFVQKAVLFPGCEFLVGVDTLIRIGDPKYYYGSKEEMIRCLNIIKNTDCRFTALERNQLKPSEITDQYLPEILIGITKEGQGYTPVDISSTMIREGKCTV